MRHNQQLRTTAIRSLTLLIVYILVIPVGIHAQAPGKVVSVNWSPDGNKIVITGIDGLFKIWDITKKQSVYESTDLSGLTMAAAWSPDSTRIATVAEDGIVRIWNATNGQLVATLQRDQGGPHRRVLVAWSPDGTKLASVSCETDGGFPIRFWKVNNDSYELLPTTVNVMAYDMAWSPDGKKLAVADYNGIYILDDFSPSGSKERVIAPFAVSVAWSSDGSKLATGTFDGQVQILNADTGQQIAGWKAHQGAFSAMVWSPTGDRLVTAGVDNFVRVWDITASVA